MATESDGSMEETVVPIKGWRAEEPTVSTQSINGWTPENDALLKTWQTQLYKSSYIYSVILQKYQRWYLRVQLINSVLSACISLLGVILSTLDLNNLWVSRSFGIATALLGAIVTILTNLVKIAGWDTYTDAIDDLVRTLNGMYARLTSQIYLPDINRTSATEFIPDFQKEIDSVLQNLPTIKVTDYEIAEAKYTRYVTRTPALFTPI